MTHTRPDINFVVGMVSHFMQEPHELHWKAAKHILHHIQGTHTHRLHYVVGIGLLLVGYIDLDYVGDLYSHKSTLGYMFHLNSSPIYW